MLRDETPTDVAVETRPFAETAEVEEIDWSTQIAELLRHAAEIAAQNEVDLETFMSAAYGGFLAANPDVRDRLADAKLLTEIDQLRRNGRIGQA